MLGVVVRQRAALAERGFEAQDELRRWLEVGEDRVSGWAASDPARALAFAGGAGAGSADAGGAPGAPRAVPPGRGRGRRRRGRRLAGKPRAREGAEPRDALDEWSEAGTFGLGDGWLDASGFDRMDLAWGAIDAAGGRRGRGRRVRAGTAGAGADWGRPRCANGPHGGHQGEVRGRRSARQVVAEERGLAPGPPRCANGPHHGHQAEGWPSFGSAGRRRLIGPLRRRGRPRGGHETMSGRSSRPRAAWAAADGHVLPGRLTLCPHDVLNVSLVPAGSPLAAGAPGVRRAAAAARAPIACAVSPL